MKYLFFAVAILAATFSHAYLVNGVRTTVLIEGTGRNKMIGLSIEGCDKESCTKPDYEAMCTREGPLKFYCFLKEQYPFFIRFTARINGNKILSSKFFPTNGESSLDNFKLNLTENAIAAKAIKDVL